LTTSSLPAPSCMVLDREFDNPSVINVVKTSRLRYAGHMIRRPEDLQQKAIFIAEP
jgi:hypothetical protein